MTLHLRYRPLRSAVAALALIALAGPALAGKEDNSIVVAVAADLVTADPANGTLGSDIPFLYTMYDRLFDFTPEDLTLRPMLATEWGWSDDKKTLNITLREGVKFHDGTDFNAEAVKRSLDYFKESATNLDLANVASVEVTGPYQVAINVAEVDSTLPGLLAERAGMILSPTAIEAYGKDGYGQNPVGTGPYRMKEHATGTAVFVERFADYWDPDSVSLDEIEFRVIKNATSAVTAVMTGQLDYVSAVDPVNLPAMERNPNVRIAVEPTIGFAILNINAGLAPLDDVRIRQAFSLAIDRDAIAKAVYGTLPAEPTVLPVPASYWPSTDALQASYKYDPEKARALLAEAGHPDGIHIPFCVNANAGMPLPMLKVTDIMIEQLKPAGITLDITQVASTAACVDLFATQQVIPAFMVGWSGRPDPAITYNQMLATDSYYNTSRVKYGETDAILAELKSTFDQETQDKIYDRLNEAYLEWVPMISLYRYSNVIAYKNGLVGEQPNLLGRPYVRTLRWE